MVFVSEVKSKGIIPGMDVIEGDIEGTGVVRLTTVDQAGIVHECRDYVPKEELA